MKNPQAFNKILSAITESKKKICKHFNKKDETCKTGCYSEKQLKDKECQYKEDQYNCSCFEKC